MQPPVSKQGTGGFLTIKGDIMKEKQNLFLSGQSFALSKEVTRENNIPFRRQKQPLFRFFEISIAAKRLK